MALDWIALAVQWQTPCRANFIVATCLINIKIRKPVNAFLTGSLHYLFHKLHKKFTFAMKYLAWHKVNKVKKKKKVLHIILWPQFPVPSLQSKTIYCSLSGWKITKTPAQATGFASNTTVNLSNLCSNPGTHLHSLWDTQVQIFQSSSQGKQPRQPPRDLSSSPTLGTLQATFGTDHSTATSQRSIFCNSLFAAINASLWFHLKERMCLGQLQESVVQKSYKQTSMPSSPCWAFSHYWWYLS